jgi:phosphohistidine phosphatase SixA
VARGFEISRQLAELTTSMTPSDDTTGDGQRNALKKEHRSLRRRPLFAPLLMPLFAAIAAILLLAWGWNASNTTTVLLVRHAEKMPVPPDNPPLSAAGFARAEALARWLSDSGIRTIYVSERLRTRQTAEPVAARLGAEIIERPGDDVEGLVSALRSGHRGETVLVVGHSNTLPAIVRRLGGEVAPIGESDYSRLFVVTDSPLTRTTVLSLNYGP